jgi:hypothetical protein
MTTNTISSMDDIIDVRDIIARVEELEGELEAAFGENEEGHNLETVADYVRHVIKDASPAHAHKLHDEAEEYAALTAFLDELKGKGGDEEWKGDWYPVTLIRESYFNDYAEELVKDCGYISSDLPSWIEIDWQATAENVKQDYSSVDFDDVTYWYR